MPKSGNPAKGFPKRERKGDVVVAWLALIVSALSFIVSIASAGISYWAAQANWEQVKVERQAIAENFRLSGDVEVYDLKKQTYKPLSEGARAPLPGPDADLYAIVTATNDGKGSGLVTDAGVRIAGGPSLSIEPNCESPGSSTTVACPLPLTILSGHSEKFYMLIPDVTQQAMSCAPASSTIHVYVIDSTGHQTELDSKVRPPEITTTCPSQPSH